MEFNRNHYFLMGLIVLFLGLQVKCVSAYVLTEKAAKVVAKGLGKDQTPADAGTRLQAFASAATTPAAARRTIQPPAWLGWALISIGGVLVLHSLAMNKPGGG